MHVRRALPAVLAAAALASPGQAQAGQQNVVHTVSATDPRGFTATCAFRPDHTDTEHPTTYVEAVAVAPAALELGLRCEVRTSGWTDAASVRTYTSAALISSTPVGAFLPGPHVTICVFAEARYAWTDGPGPVSACRTL